MIKRSEGWRKEKSEQMRGNNYHKKYFNEEELIKLKKEGKTNKELSQIFGINQNLVGQHIKRFLLEKKLEKKDIVKKAWNKGRVVETTVRCIYCEKEKRVSPSSLLNHGDRWFCNRECEREFYKNRVKINKICEECKKEYLTNREDQKYCSNKCKMDGCKESAIKNAKEKYTPERRSEVLKKMWKVNRGEILEKRNTNEYREQVSRHSIEKFKDEKVREKHLNSINKSWTEERRQKHREITINRIAKSNEGVITKPNLIVGSLLNRMGINYEYEKPIEGICRPDIQIDEKRYIEIYGDYWHCNPITCKEEKTYSQDRNIERDIKKRERIKIEYPEIKILVLWETDIYFNLTSIEERIKKFIENEHYEYPVLNLRDFELRKIDRERARLFLSLYHYLHTVPLICSVFYGLFHKESLIGVSVWGNPTARNKEDKKRMELYRFCLVDGLPKNTATYFLSRSIKSIEKEYRDIEELISYADTGYHLGTIYKASNWLEIGEVSGSYYYVNKDGVELDRRKIANHCSTLGIVEREYVEKLELRRVDENKKKKYIYEIKGRR